MKPNWHDLMERYLSGVITDEEAHLLEAALKADPQLRDRYLDALNLDSALEMTAEAAEMVHRLPMSPAAIALAPAAEKSRGQGFQWRPLTAAAAGLVIGLFSASLVFGYVMPSWKMRREIFSDSFESPAKPVVDGQQPFEPGRWGGDFTEVIGTQGKVRPAEGQRMLRFLRADYEGHHLPDSFSSDSFQLLDLRPYKAEFADGTAVVRLSASFNGGVSTVEGPFACVLKLYALDAELVEERKAGTFTGSIRERMLANSSSTRVRLDADPSTWQKVGNELRVPPGTDYLMIQVGMTNDNKLAAGRKDAFAAHFVDGVQVVLAHVPEVTLP